MMGAVFKQQGLARAALLALTLLAALVCASGCLPAHAFAVDDSDIGVLSSRYSSLEEFENKTDATDNVVTQTSVNVLTSANLSLDGRSVTFSGEVVGDIMNAQDGNKWLNVLDDDGSSIGVLVTQEMADRVLNVGDHNTTGTTLQVSGIYHLDCGEHQGELDVHATDIRVLDAGGAITHGVDAQEIRQGFILCGVAFGLLVLFLLIRHIMDWRNDREDREDEALFKTRRMSHKALEEQRRKAREDEGEL